MEQIETVIAALERAPEIIIPLVYEVPQAILKRRPKPGKWSAHEHACHMAEVHSMIFPRLDYILTDPHPVITPYFPSSDEEDGAFLKVNLGEAMSRFAADRRSLAGRPASRLLRFSRWLSASARTSPFSPLFMPCLKLNS
jgi:hypothetical protein